MAVVKVSHNKTVYPVGIYANNMSFKEILFVSYSEKENHFSPLLHGFKYEYFAKNIIQHMGFKYNKNWYHKF